MSENHQQSRWQSMPDQCFQIFRKLSHAKISVVHAFHRSWGLSVQRHVWHTHQFQESASVIAEKHFRNVCSFLCADSSCQKILCSAARMQHTFSESMHSRSSTQLCSQWRIHYHAHKEVHTTVLTISHTLSYSQGRAHNNAHKDV